MRKSIVVTSVVLSALAVKGQAQQKPKGDTTLKSTTIEVIQSYKPEVKQTPKPEFTADLPPRDTAKPAFRYAVPQQTLFYTYSSLPLRPLALGKDTDTLPFPSYLKLGGGNLSTFYLDAGVGSLKGDNYESAIHLHHLSQNGRIKNQRISLSGLEAEGTLHTGNNAWRLSVEGLRNQYHYYGYDHAMHDYQRDTVKQTFTGLEATLDVQNERPNSLGLNYHPMVKASIYGDRFDAVERTVAFAVPVTKDLDTSLQAGLGINGVFTQLNTTAGNRGNNIFQITPMLNFHSGNFKARVGIYPTFGMGGNTHLLPDVQLSYQLPNTQFSISAGWEARLRQNTYKQLSSYNPYMFNLFDGRQTRMDEVFAMAKSNIGNHVTATARISWWQMNNLPMFLNDSGDRKNFYVLYDQRVNALSFEATLRYQVANSLSVGITGTFYNYYQTTYGRVWHEPAVRVKGDLMIRPLPALMITAYAMLLDQNYALNEAHQETKLDGVFDIGGGAEYQIIPRLSAFLNLHNLLNNRYERWYRYENYGFNIYGGLRLKF